MEGCDMTLTKPKLYKCVGIKETVMLLLVSILLVGSLSGCEVVLNGNPAHTEGSESVSVGSETEPTETEGEETTSLMLLQNQIAQSGSTVGVAFIGYVSYDSSDDDLYTYLSFSTLGNEYPFLSEASLLMNEGEELYAIVPTSPAGQLKVLFADMTDGGEPEYDYNNPIYVGSPGEALLLRCNVSEIYSNVRIIASDGGGAFDFSPSLSMMNGQLTEIAGVYDFSLYVEQPDENSVRIAMELLQEVDDIRAALENGMKLLYTGDSQLIAHRNCMLFALGTEHDEHFVREQLYGVCDNLIFAYDAVNDTWNVLSW